MNGTILAVFDIRSRRRARHFPMDCWKLVCWCEFMIPGLDVGLVNCATLSEIGISAKLATGIRQAVDAGGIHPCRQFLLPSFFKPLTQSV